MSDAYIVCENLVKVYQVAEIEVVALQGLDLSVAAGEFWAIIGASGSGKSTLLNVLGGLDRPSAGRVLVDGRDLLKLPGPALDRYRRRKLDSSGNRQHAISFPTCQLRLTSNYR